MLLDREWTAADSKRHFSRSRSTSKGRRTDYAPPTDPDEPTA